MLLKVIVLLLMAAILVSLGSALLFLFRQQGDDNNRRMALALSWRIGLSLTLFVLLMAGFYFGFIPSSGLSIAPR